MSIQPFSQCVEQGDILSFALGERHSTIHLKVNPTAHDNTGENRVVYSVYHTGRQLWRAQCNADSKRTDNTSHAPQCERAVLPSDAVTPMQVTHTVTGVPHTHITSSLQSRLLNWSMMVSSCPPSSMRASAFVK